MENVVAPLILYRCKSSSEQTVVDTGCKTPSIIGGLKMQEVLKIRGDLYNWCK